MRKLSVICLLLAALQARGDVVVVEQITEARMQPQTITLKIKGDKYRKDFSNGTSAIYDMTTGDTIRIDHQKKTFRKLSGKEVAAAIEGYQRMSGAKPAAPPKIVDTGKMEKVDGHDAEVYTAAAPGSTYTYWLTKDYPDFASVNEEMKKFQERSDIFDKSESLASEASELDGIVVKSQSLSSGGEVTTITLISAKVQAIDDSEFQAPQGYTEIFEPPPRPIPAPAIQ
jgi:hypothetical protein